MAVPPSGLSQGTRPPAVTAHRSGRFGTAAMSGAIAAVLLSEAVAALVPVDRWPVGLLGFGLLVLGQAGWSYRQRSRGRATPLLVFFEVLISICLGRLLATAVQGIG